MRNIKHGLTRGPPARSGSLSATQDFVVSENATAFAGIAGTYQGESVGNFDVTANRQIYPAYTRLDLRAGVRYTSSWLFNLYATNVTDKRAIIGGGGSYNFPPTSYVVIQPRTIGLTAQYSF